MSSDRGHGQDQVEVVRRRFGGLIERIEESAVWTIEKRRVGETEPYEISTFEGNLLLNEGMRSTQTSQEQYDYTNPNGDIKSRVRKMFRSRR